MFDEVGNLLSAQSAKAGASMTMDPVIVPDVVRNGVVVPQAGVVLPEGAEVQITVPAPVPPELKEELDDWERLGDEAWGHISDWEKEG